MSTRWADIEAEIASDVAAWMSSQGWEVRCEVPDPTHVGRRRPAQLDLCGIREKVSGVVETLAVEVKMNLTLDLYAQAMRWVPQSTFVAVAFSGPDVPVRIWPIVRQIAQAASIGVLGCQHSGCREIVAPERTGALSASVIQLADSARRSSAGLIAPAGSRSPRRMKFDDLEAEAIFDLMNRTDMQGTEPPRQASLASLLPFATREAMERIAKNINSRRGRSLGLMARRFGKDFIIYRK